MRILKKRVNEVEKEISKKTGKLPNEGDMEQDKQNPRKPTSKTNGKHCMTWMTKLSMRI